MFNIVYWPSGETMESHNTQPSLISAQVLALDAEHIADPLPPLVAMLDEMTAEVHTAAQAKFQARHG
jgi:hypothetical protein